MTAQPTEAKPRERPVSPHLQIYRWPVTMLTSILHRATGVGNAIGAVLVTAWLAATAAGSDTFGMMHELLSSIWGKLILFGFTLSLSYHLLNGIRHLVWDTGTGFGLKTARNSGLAVIVLSVVLTLIIWAVATLLGGHKP